jgi:hypothetical protein
MQIGPQCQTHWTPYVGGHQAQLNHFRPGENQFGPHSLIEQENSQVSDCSSCAICLLPGTTDISQLWQVDRDFPVWING